MSSSRPFRSRRNSCRFPEVEGLAFGTLGYLSMMSKYTACLKGSFVGRVLDEVTIADDLVKNSDPSSFLLSYPCRKDAHRMECGRSADQAQRCDGGHKCQPYASRAVVSWSRDPEELAAKFRLILG